MKSHMTLTFLEQIIWNPQQLPAVCLQVAFSALTAAMSFSFVHSSLSLDEIWDDELSVIWKLWRLPLTFSLWCADVWNVNACERRSLAVSAGWESDLGSRFEDNQQSLNPQPGEWRMNEAWTSGGWSSTVHVRPGSCWCCRHTNSVLPSCSRCSVKKIMNLSAFILAPPLLSKPNRWPGPHPRCSRVINAPPSRR